MRIVVHGQQAFGKSVLEALLERGENVVASTVPPRRPRGEADRSSEGGRARPGPSRPSAAILRNKPEVREESRGLKADLCVMAYVTLIVPEEVLNLPTRGTIQYHPRCSPAIAGPVHQLADHHGETRTGLTIFWPDQGLDTGPILLRRKWRSGTPTPWAASTSIGCIRWAFRRCWRRWISCARARRRRPFRTNPRRRTKGGARRNTSRSTGRSRSRRSGTSSAERSPAGGVDHAPGDDRAAPRSQEARGRRAGAAGGSHRRRRWRDDDRRHWGTPPGDPRGRRRAEGQRGGLRQGAGCVPACAWVPCETRTTMQ